MNITGTHVNYYFVCKRELWFFSHALNMEHNSDLVLLGKLVDESSYQREERGINIDNTIVIDWIEGNPRVIHEVKKSDSVEKAHEAQVLYYIYYLKKLGVEGVKGELDYPKLKKRVMVELTPEKEARIEETIDRIREIVELPSPPPIEVKRSFCRNCSYFQLCYS